MPEEHLFSLPTAIILLLLFIAIFFTIVYIASPEIKQGWVTYLFISLNKLLGVP